MRDIEVGCKLGGSDVIHDPNKYFVEYPIKVFAAGRIVVFANGPLKLEIIEKSPVFDEFWTFQEAILANRIF